MFSIFKQRQELKDELTAVKMRLGWVEEMNDKYLGVISAYKSAIHKLHSDGVINAEQFQKFYDEVEKYQNMQQTT